MAEEKKTISILGSGAWANTLAFLLGQQNNVILWDRNPTRLRQRLKTRRFKKPVKRKYPDNVTLTDDLKLILKSKLVISAISLKGMQDVFTQIRDLKPAEDIVFLNASKGIDSQNLKTPTEIIHEFCPDNHVAVISGPNLAKELIDGMPMVTEVACQDDAIACMIQEYLNSPSLRVYRNTDVKGVELCGAIKNVMAIAAGCADALKLGVSAKASLITRGLHEIGVFLDAYDCSQKSLMGPAGIGDLVATCSSNLSRNYRVGYYLAEGKKLEKIIEKLGEVAEGVNTTRAVHKICQEKNIQMPICEQIYMLIEGEVTAVGAGMTLMSRPVK